MGIILPRYQGYMSVESKALDEAFAGTGISPRQRLISAAIDYATDEIDCATVEFSDPNALIAQCIRSSKTDPKTGKLTFIPWTVRIGYFDQPPEEMTTLTGIPQMEFADFPETGDPIIRLKVLNSSVALRSNVTPGGDPAIYLNPPTRGDKNGPLYRSLASIADFYGLSLDLGQLEEVINEIDKRVADDFEAARLGHLQEPQDAVFLVTGDRYDGAPILGYSSLSLSRLQLPTKGQYQFESDYDWLRRVAGIVSSLIASGQIEFERDLAEYFNAIMPGKVATSDIKVVVGIRADKLVFKPNYDFIMENGFKDGIPVLDYRNGNFLLRSFLPSADSSANSMGAWASVMALFRGAKTATVEHEGPTKDSELRKDDDPSAVSPHTVNKRLFFPSGTTNSETPVLAWVDDLRRHMAMNVQGTAVTFGIPKFLCGQLVGFAGLGWGPAAEKAASDTEADEPQPFANYNRLYFVTRAKHKMGQSGIYDMDIAVSACATDGSEKKVIASFLDRLKKGVESGSGAGGALSQILGSTI